jgi:hypothetical protein
MSFQEEKDIKMAPGDIVEVAGYSFTFNGVKAVEGPNYSAAQGDFDLAVNGKFAAQDEPGKAQLPLVAMPMTEAAIDAGFLRDVYVSLGEPIDRDKPEGEWAVRVYYKPFVDWIWGGCVLMALGGLLAMLDRRYRIKARAAANRQNPGWNPTSMNRYYWILGAFAALVALLAVGLGLNPRDVPSPLVGKPAPAFSLNCPSWPRRTRRSAPRTCRARSGCSTSGPRGAFPAAPSTRCWSSSRRRSTSR